MSAASASFDRPALALPRRGHLRRPAVTRAGAVRRQVLVGVVVAVLVGAGCLAALAYWASSGSGLGAAAAGDARPVTVRSSSAAIVGLYPGGPAQSVSGSFDNGNPGDVHVHAVTVAVGAVTGGPADPSLPACTAADFVLGQPAPVDAQVASGTDVGRWGGASIAMVNAPRDQGNCRGASVVLALSST